MELLDLCYDVLIRILEEVNPEDLAACASCSWGFNAFIKENRRLWKTLYLKNFDDPRDNKSIPEPRWDLELPRIVECEKIMKSEHLEVKRLRFKFVADTIQDLVGSSSDVAGPSRNLAYLSELFETPINLNVFLCSSSLFGRTASDDQTPAPTMEEQQLSAELHCYYGIPRDSLGRRSLRTHPYARSKIYDLRNYTDNTRWGPFLDDGSLKVDWEMLEAIMIDLAYNSQVFCDRFADRHEAFRSPWVEPFGGVIRSKLTYPSTLPMEPDIPLDLKDPYGISGDWMRIVCFLDYNDLYDYNFKSGPIPSSEPRPPIHTEEAIRYIIMCLKVTKVETPGQFDNQALPIVHFTGTSQSIDHSWDPNASSKIRGMVRLTPEGEVRWSTVSVFYGGEERWKSEGIQVGGIRSARGVMGSWFDKDYDPHGPAGPTAFWKLRDRCKCKSDDSDDDSEWVSEEESE